MIVAGPGVGKTRIAAQLVRGRLGLCKDFLGMPIKPGKHNVLYLAMDRPEQIRALLALAMRDDDRHVIEKRLRVWKGPPDFDFSKHTDELLRMCTDADADTVIVDSVKDAAVGISEDEVGAAYNRCRQRVLVAGVEVIELHHNVKRGINGARPITLEDVYGSRWITAGAGSVVMLTGEAGDPMVGLRHIKQPVDDVGPLTLVFDPKTQRAEIQRGTDLMAIVRSSPEGITAAAAAALVHETATASKNQIEKTRRRLDKLVGRGLLTRTSGRRGGDHSMPAIYGVSDIGDLLGDADE
jgi:replicative DNA helicase